MRVTVSSRRRIAVAVSVLVLLCSAVTGVVGAQTWWAADTPARAAIQGPRPAVVKVTPGPGAAPVTCPQGAVPYVNITFANFKPNLVDGTRFRSGRYRISLSGQVANETTSAIVIDRDEPWTLSHQPWPAGRVRAPMKLAANSSGRLRITGTFRAITSGHARLGATLHWHWASPRLAACGARGLIDDD
jgi:hypothetical protein